MRDEKLADDAAALFGRLGKRYNLTEEGRNALKVAKSEASTDDRVTLVPPADADSRTVPCPWLRVARGSRKHTEYLMAGWTEGDPTDPSFDMGYGLALAALSKIAESAGWEGEEPLAEWLTERLGTAEAQQEMVSEIRSRAEHHGYDPAGPQRLTGFLLQAMDRAALLDPVVRLANEHGRPLGTAVVAFLAEKIAHNSRIAHQHSEQVRSLDKKLVQEGQRITHLKLRFQELRDLVAEALEI